MTSAKSSFTSTILLGAMVSVLSVARPAIVLGEIAIWCENPIAPPKSPPPRSRCLHPCPDCKASPCYARSGVFLTTTVDLQVPTAGPPLAASRTYNGAYLSSGLSGPGWAPDVAVRLSYFVYLYSFPNTYLNGADIRMPDNQTYTFIENPDKVTYAPPLGRSDKLIKQPDGSWTLTIQNSRTSWQFSQDGSLASITDDYGNVQTWTYDTNGRVQRVTDVGSGRYLDVYFGADGRLSAVQDSAGRLVQYAYNTNGSLASVTDPLNRVTTYTYSQGRFGPILTQIKDHWNRVVATMTYDASDRVMSYNEDGETYTLDYSQEAQNKTIKKDSQNNQWTVTTTATEYVTDRAAPNGAVLHKDFNADGSVQGVTDEVGIRTTYIYDSPGRVLSVSRDATHNGARSDYTYDPAYPDKVTSVTVKDPSTNQVDPTWQSWQYDYYQSDDPAPGALHHVYRVQTDGVTKDTVATYAYDTQGRITQQIIATGAQTDYTYDAQGNLLTVTGPANNDLGTRPVTTYGYDALGRVTSVTDPLGHVTTTTYDAVGRVLTVTLPKPTPSSPLDFTTTYSYDNWDPVSGLVFTTITDPNGKLTRQGYDALGRLVKSIDALNNTTTYAYTRDLLTSITDANNNVTSYTYDALKRLTRTTFPDTAHEDYTYWNDGLLKTKTDRKGQTITYAYDALKRLASKTFPASKVITYTYQGQALTEVTDATVTPSETHAFAYDASYRLQSTSEGTRGTIEYTYAPDDRVATMEVQGGPTTTYGYYPDGSLHTIDWSPVTGQFTYAYALTGQYQTITLPNGQTRSYGYDDQGRLAQLGNVHPTAGTLASFAYGYDLDPQTQQPTLLGQRTSVSMTIPSQGLTNATSSYRYDNDYQLTQASYPSVAPYNGEVHAWTYDAIGNRLTNTVNGVPQTYTYFKNGSNQLNGQRLQSDSVNAYTYDANGNTLTRNGSGGTFTFGWNTDDRMTSISGAATASYTYDYQGRRTAKTVGGSTTTYLYDGLNLIHTSGSTPADYLFGPGIDEPLAMNQSGNVSYFSVDGLGSVNLLTDTAGMTQNAYLYDAWGVIKSQTGTLATDFGYTGREFAEAGLWYYRARYYQSGIGRFGSEDRLRTARASLFSYVDNDPLGAIDPTGLEGEGCTYGPWTVYKYEETTVRERTVWRPCGSRPIEIGYGEYTAESSSCWCIYCRQGVQKLIRPDFYEKSEVSCPPCFRHTEYHLRSGALFERYIRDAWGPDGPPKRMRLGVWNSGLGGCLCPPVRFDL
jgi:RHS repeat-associated protein